MSPLQADMEVIFLELHQLCGSKEWRQCDEVLQSLLATEQRPIVLAGALRATAPVRKELEHWEALYDLVAENDSHYLRGL